MTHVRLNDSLCYKLFYLVKLNEQLIDQKMKPFNLSRTQWKVLARFNFLPAPCTQQQLLTSMGIDRAHLTRTLDQLQQRELLIRKSVPHDKRAYQVLLTSSGQQLLKKIEQVLTEESSLLSQQIAPEKQVEFEQHLEQIKSNIVSALEQSK